LGELFKPRKTLQIEGNKQYFAMVTSRTGPNVREKTCGGRSRWRNPRIGNQTPVTGWKVCKRVFPRHQETNSYPNSPSNSRASTKKSEQCICTWHSAPNAAPVLQKKKKRKGGKWRKSSFKKPGHSSTFCLRSRETPARAK